MGADRDPVADLAGLGLLARLPAGRRRGQEYDTELVPVSSDASADQLATARSYIESALGGMSIAVDAVPQAWGAIQGAGSKYIEKYGRMAEAGGRLQEAAAQMQRDIAELSADEAAERNNTA